MMYTRIFMLLCGILLMAQFAECQSAKIEFERYDPVSTLVVPEHPVSKAKFPFIDVHNHQNNLNSSSQEELVKEMDLLNMK
jgi:hypothetical protein